VPTSKQSATTNPAGGLKIVRDDSQQEYKRGDFFRDLKKVAKKQDRPSQRDSKSVEHPAGIVPVVVVKPELSCVLR
jgi:hypothetical protein